MSWHPTLIDSAILAVHAALLPIGDKGTVLMLGGSEHNPAQGGTDEMPADPANVDRTALYDVDARAAAVRITSPTTDVFCSGHAFVGDGRLLIGGGTESWGGDEAGGPGGGHVHQHGNFGGHRACWMFNYLRRMWTRAADLTFEVGPGMGGGRWYPSLVSLPSGDVVAFGGHPSRQSEQWHENDIPERYSAAAGFWSRYPNAIPFEHPSLPGNWYPRVSLVRGGWIFLTTRHENECRFFDPSSGNLVGPVVAAPPSPYNVGWDYSVIQLPLLPGDDYRSRVMAVNGVQPSMIELNLEPGAPTPVWTNAGTRQGSAATKVRNFSCPVYLPTGQILVSGGINGMSDAAAVKEPEVFTPNIDWTTRTYSGSGIGTWQTLEGEPAQIARNYHSTALLLPDGSVFVSGSNIDAASGDPAVVGQRNIELYQPAYFSNPARPQLVDAPRQIGYERSEMTVTVGSTAQAAAIRKVALVRCGSVTHAADFDQRYVALPFTHVAGTANLTVTLPRDASVLPPGYYLLWVVDAADLPCQLARFVRFGHVSCQVYTDRSTFSEEEVMSYGAGGATFPFAVYAVYDGFLPGELTGTPSTTVTWADTGVPIPTTDIALVPTETRWLEHPAAWEDVAQRITYPYTVEIRNPGVYSTFLDTRRVRVTFALGGQTCSETLDLTKAPNPYMIDVDPVERNPHWLSTDIRTFRVRAGEVTSIGGIHGSGAGAPANFIRAVIDNFRGQPNNASHPFRSLPREGDSAAVDLAPMEGTRRVYNYAFARVRYRAATTAATRVKVFFRLCTTAATGLEYNTSTVYRHSGPGPGTVPRLGVAGGEIASIPFFQSARVETVAGRAGATTMDAQPFATNYEFQTVTPTAGAEVTAYFGCWLDINEPGVKRFPLNPGGTEGPWPEAACQPIQEFFRSPHQCLVAEVYFEPDPIDPGETPGSSDNLAQRNLVLLHTDNPGAPGSHYVLHPFEIKPSIYGVPKPDGMFATPMLAAGGYGDHAAEQRYGPDELLVRWHNLPRESKVTLYFSDVDTAEIQWLAAAFRRSPAAFEVVDTHTLRLQVANGTWLPVPATRIMNIPALLSIQLPDTIVSGQEFRVSIHQVSGRTGRVIGSVQITIPVSSAVLILDREIRTLSVMKHIATTIPTTNRWYPIFLRYLHGLALRVDALGGNASTVYPNPDGSGRPVPEHVPPTGDGDGPSGLAAAVAACCRRMSLLLGLGFAIAFALLVVLLILTVT